MPNHPVLIARSGRVPRSVKFCRDCQHCAIKRELFVIPVQLCGHPKVSHVVTGAPLYRCTEMRNKHAPCGEGAKLFQAPPSAPERVVVDAERPRALSMARIAELFGRPILEARARRAATPQVDDALEILMGERAA